MALVERRLRVGAIELGAPSHDRWCTCDSELRELPALRDALLWWRLLALSLAVIIVVALAAMGATRVRCVTPGRRLRHQILLLAPLRTTAGEGAVLTPDGDSFMADLDLSINLALNEVAWDLRRRELPQGVEQRDTYEFGPCRAPTSSRSCWRRLTGSRRPRIACIWLAVLWGYGSK